MSSENDLTEVRREYIGVELHMEDLLADPVAQFGQWHQQMAALDPQDSTSMVLATATSDGCPSARIVLLKHFDSEGFCWYTDYQSQKGRELDENPQAELLFYWRPLERQVRIWGAVERLPREQAELYFGQRPRGSQLSASASVQSTVVSSRSELQQRYQSLEQQYPEGVVVPCPENWGGYILRPERFEFWQGRENRLHDRVVYSQQLDGWHRVRLAP